MVLDSGPVMKRLTAVLAAGSLVALTALGVRIHRTGSLWFLFMAWNLVLALIPYLLAWALRLRFIREKRVTVGFVAVALGWLVFLPNAPYVLTDVVHLGNDVLWWYDLPLVMTFAGTAWLAGLMSLALVDEVLQQAVGRSFARGVVFCSCWVCGMGVYVGRFLRFNSWDVLQKPRALTTTVIERLVPPWSHPHAHVFALFFAVLLLGSYGTFALITSIKGLSGPIKARRTNIE